MTNPDIHIGGSRPAVRFRGPPSGGTRGVGSFEEVAHLCAELREIIAPVPIDFPVRTA